MVAFLSFGIILCIALPIFLFVLLCKAIGEYIDNKRVEKYYEEFKQMFPDTWKDYPIEDDMWMAKYFRELRNKK